jgi:hypothetical protein
LKLICPSISISLPSFLVLVLPVGINVTTDAFLRSFLAGHSNLYSRQYNLTILPMFFFKYSSDNNSIPLSLDEF